MLSELEREFRLRQEERLQRLVAAGVDIARLRQVTRADCPHCHGSGRVLTLLPGKIMQLRECSCLELQLDGQKLEFGT